MKTRHGFALVEVVALGVVASILAALLLVVGHETRRAGRLGEDIAKLRVIAGLTQEYAADNTDQFWTFSWRAGESHSQWPELNNAPNDGVAVANQLIDILRRRAGRLDISPTLGGFLGHITYSHVPLLDYAERVPDETFISAADEYRLKWSRDPQGFDRGFYQPAPAGVPGDPGAKRWAYSASFVISTPFFDKSMVPSRVYPADHSHYFIPGNARFGAKLVSDVAFPDQKVFVSDSNARHFGTTQTYCTHDQARLPLLSADGSVVVKAAAESNPGWQPNAPTSSAGTSFAYIPAAWEPRTFSGQVSELVKGRFRWTRGFLDGVDFGGPEVCTGQPGCP